MYFINGKTNSQSDCAKCPYIKNQPDANLLIKNIWLGNINVSQDINFLREKGIDKIISIMEKPNIYKKYSNIKYYTVPISDKYLIDKKILTHKIFDKVGKIINQDNILIHCKRGHHRSASCLAAYLVKYHNYDYELAIKKINNARKCALRRNAYMKKWLPSYN